MTSSADLQVELDGLLSTREGWWREEYEDDDLPLWCFGLEGACTIAIRVQALGFVIYVHAEDEEYLFHTIHQVEAWLREYEPEPALTPLQNELLDILYRAEVERHERGED